MPVQLLNLICEIMANFKKYLLGLTLGDKDDYLKHVKPVIILMRIFRNMFINRYIPFGSLISMNQNYIVEILFSLCELIFSIKLENLLGYVAKSNVTYSIVKIVFCEYVSYLDFQKFSQFMPGLVKLVEEGIECLDNVALIHTHQIVTINLNLF
jgi:hypothetical protein